jgi:hypothetical protein
MVRISKFDQLWQILVKNCLVKKEENKLKFRKLEHNENSKEHKELSKKNHGSKCTDKRRKTFSLEKARSLDSSEVILDWKHYVKYWKKMRRAEFLSKTKNHLKK